ncbi:MAG: class I adenylate-forming enzyme family protein, partial [Mycobacterium sp.]
MGIGDLLARCAEAASDATAVINGRSYTYGALESAARLVADDLTPGTRVLIELDNTAASIAAIHAVWMAGSSVVSASHMVPPAEVRRRAEATGASAILTPCGPQGLEVAVADTGVRASAPAGEALVMFTSGTTGTPKGASLTSAALLASVAGVASGSGIGADGRLPRVPARDPQLILVPLAHMGGLLGSLSAWWLGKPMLLVEKFSVNVVFDLVQRYRLGVLKLTPAMVWDLVQADHDGVLPGITSATVGTAALPEVTRVAFERKFGVAILRNYGQTEFAGAIAFERPDDVAAGIRPDNTVGRVAPGVEVAIVDPNGNRLPVGEVGEITARAASAMSGYLDTDGEPAEPGEWLHT